MKLKKRLLAIGTVSMIMLLSVLLISVLSASSAEREKKDSIPGKDWVISKQNIIKGEKPEQEPKIVAKVKTDIKTTLNRDQSNISPQHRGTRPEKSDSIQ